MSTTTSRYREVAKSQVGPYHITMLQNARGQTALSVHYAVGAGKRVLLEDVGQFDTTEFEKALRKNLKDLEDSVRAAGSDPGEERPERCCMRQLGSRIVTAIHTSPSQVLKEEKPKEVEAETGEEKVAETPPPVATPEPTPEKAKEEPPKGTSKKRGS